MGRPERSASDESLVEETDRGRDARKEIPADPQPVEHFGAVDVGKLFALDVGACLAEHREGALDVAVVRVRHRLALEGADVELDGAGAEARRAGPACTPRSTRRSVPLRAARRRGRGSPRPWPARLRRRRSARKPASTPRRSASHSIVSEVGRVLPRSIWEMYSLEKRSPAMSVCVRPAATRSWRRRSPRRGALVPWAAPFVNPRAAREVIGPRSMQDTSPDCNPPEGTVPQKGHRYTENRVNNCILESLDRAT